MGSCKHCNLDHAGNLLKILNICNIANIMVSICDLLKTILGGHHYVFIKIHNNIGIA